VIPLRKAKPQAKGSPKRTSPRLTRLLDWVLPDFFAIRNSGGADFLPATQNVTFILNIIDALAGDERFLEIRKRTRKHRTLAKIDQATQKYRKTEQEDQDEFLKEIESKLQDAQTSFEEKIAAVDKIEGLNRNTREQRKEAVRRLEQARLQAEIRAQSKRKTDTSQKGAGSTRRPRSLQALCAAYPADSTAAGCALRIFSTTQVGT